MIKYGLIGCGNAGKVHQKVISKLSSKVKLRCIFDIDVNKRNEIKKYNPEILVVDNIKDFLVNVDAVSICTPHNTHYDLAKKVLSYNKDVLIEKPVSINLGNVLKLNKIAEENDLIAATIFQHRYEPVNNWIKEHIDSGKMGELLSIDVQVKWSKKNEYFNSWKGNLKEAGGGVLINQAIHFIDLANWFGGGIAEVYARKIQHRNMYVEDNAIASLKFNSGAIGSINATTSSQKHVGTGLEIIGTEDNIRTHEGRIINWSSKSKSEIEGLNEKIRVIDSETWGKKYFGYGHIYQIEDFVDRCIDRKTPKISVLEGAKTLSVVLSMYKSIKIKKNVKVKYL